MKDTLVITFFLFLIGESSFNGKIVFVRTAKGLSRLPVIMFNSITMSCVIYMILFLTLSSSFTYNAYLLAKKYRKSSSKVLLNLSLGILFLFVALSYAVCIFIEWAFLNVFNTLSIIVISILIIILLTLMFAPSVVIVPLHDFFFLSIYNNEYSEIASFINREHDVSFVLEIIERVNSLVELLTTEGVVEIFGLNIMVVKGELFTAVIATNVFIDYYIRLARRIIKNLESSLKLLEEGNEDLSFYAAKLLISELKNVLVL